MPSSPDAVLDFEKGVSGVDAHDLMSLLVMIRYFDALGDIGQVSNTIEWLARWGWVFAKTLLRVGLHRTEMGSAQRRRVACGYYPGEL